MTLSCINCITNRLNSLCVLYCNLEKKVNEHLSKNEKELFIKEELEKIKEELKLIKEENNLSTNRELEVVNGELQIITPTEKKNETENHKNDSIR